MDIPEVQTIFKSGFYLKRAAVCSSVSNILGFLTKSWFASIFFIPQFDPSGSHEKFAGISGRVLISCK